MKQMSTRIEGLLRARFTGLALASLTLTLASGTALAQEGTWNVNTPETNPVVGSKAAVPGGTLVWGQSSFSSGLNYLVVGDVDSSKVFGLVVESLCDTNPITGEDVPMLAEKWLVSPDKMTIKVKLNEKAKYADGSPVVAKDFKTYWDLVQNPKHLTAQTRSNLESMKGIDVIDDHNLVVNFTRVHFRNIENMCGLMALKTDFWTKGDFNKDFNTKIFGSGPYEVVDLKRGEEVTLKRRKDYWGWSLPQNQGRYNFEKLIVRRVNDDSIMFEMFKKGDIDMFRFSRASQWKTETDSEHFKNNWVVARRADSSMPKGFSGVILNMRRKGLDQVQVRQALALAMDTNRYIKDLFHNNYTPLASYYPGSMFASPNLKPAGFDLKKARALLAEAGFTKVNDKGVLVNKDGVALSFNYLYTDKATERYLTIYKDDLKKIGVELNMEFTTWATLTKKLDTFSFDMTGIAWSGSLNPDPTQLWLGKYANIESSNNYPGLADPELDKLIESSYPLYDRAERAKVFHKIDEKIASHHPYILNWYLDHYRIGYQNKFGFPDNFMPNYIHEWNAWHYAWFDAEKAKALAEARKANKPLPPIPGLKGPNS